MKQSNTENAASGASRIWVLRLLTGLVAVGLVVGTELLLRLAFDLGPAPLVVERAEHDGKLLRATNRLYAQRFFTEQRGRLAAAGQMAEHSFVAPAPENLYRVVFVGASTVQGFPHPRRLAAPSFLQAMLSDALPGRTVEVVNLGITSIASFAVARTVEDALELQPDLVVVYSGHNEFFGVYGAGEGAAATYNRLAYGLRQLGLARALDGLLAGLGGGGSEEADLIQLMARRGEVSAASPRRAAAEEHLRSNLHEIGRTCAEAGVPLVLCTVASNDAGFAPAGSARDEAAVAAQVERAAGLLVRDYVPPEAAAEALDSLRRAEAEGPTHAWAAYLQGRALERLGRAAEAREAYERARDLDTMPWRAPTGHNQVIRAAAREVGAGLADVEEALRQAAPPEGVGWGLMVDHVHFSVEGQILLARTVLDRVPGADPGLLRPLAEYGRLLGDVPVERLAVYQKMASMLEQPPLERYNGHNARYLKQLAGMEWQRLGPTERRAYEEWTRGGRRTPLILAVADSYFAAGNFSAAREAYRVARLEAPYTRRGDLWAAVQWGWSIRRQGAELGREELEVLRQALQRASFLAQDPAIDPAFIDFSKGQLYHLLDEGGPALVHLERAFEQSAFRQEYLLSLFHALAAELVAAGRTEDARRYARLAGEESGQTRHLLGVVEQYLSATP